VPVLDSAVLTAQTFVQEVQKERVLTTTSPPPPSNN
jgi:hypothetical protein